MGADPVVSRYSEIARAILAGHDLDDRDAEQAKCFGAACYEERNSLEVALRSSLGCGSPVVVASLAPGETVLDLGSGGGLDVLLSARRVGPDGVAYGLDASPDMLMLAREHASSAGVTNARFLAGRIEDIPLSDAHVDAVISNCVINLSADKQRVLAEAFRVLKPGGRLGVADLIVDEHAASAARALAEEEETGCAALTESEYRQHLESAGFTGIRLTRIRQVGDGRCSAIIQAVKPTAPVPAR